MENPKLHFSFANFSSTLKGMGTGRLRPDLAWRVTISLGAIAAIGIAVFGYFTYMWAINASISTPTPGKRDTTALSLTDLESIIATYQEKEAAYKTLLHARPTPPSYARGKGAVASSTPDVTSTTTSPNDVLNVVTPVQ